MIEHPFGRTGHRSTRAIFGAASLGNVSQDEADKTLEDLLEHGVNHIDTAASYGAAEDRIGPWMREHRKDFFLATKTGERTYQKAREQIRRSLERLRVPQLDLIQLHCLIEEDEWQLAMSEDGALRAAVEARDEGLVRFIGVTGHGLGVARMHARSLERFGFDSVLLPWSFMMAQNATYAREFHALCQTCRERGVAIQTIKGITRRPWGEQPHTAACWYQPLHDQASIDAAVGWVLSHQGLFLNTIGDIHVLPLVLDSIARFEGGAPQDFEAQLQAIAREQEMAPLFA